MVMSLLPPPNTLFGRAAEFAWLRATFAGGARLVTVVGPPGVGKSALARAYAAGAAAEGGAPRVRIIDASGARSADELSRRLGHARELPSWRGPEGGAADALFHALGPPGPCLLVVDNFEAAVECAAQLPLRWLDEAPGLRLLVTSRERLRVGDEAVLSLEPLRVAAERSGDEGDALRLLLEATRRARPGFEPDRRERALLRAIAAGVEGLPLALELAAGRLRLLSPAQLLGRLDRQLDALGQGRRDGAGRHRSLRAAIEASWASLTPCEQAALSQCAALGEGFSLERAEAAVDLSAFDAPPPVFDLLHALVEKSLLRAEPPAGGAGPRFALLACVREYAAERRSARAEQAAPASPPGVRKPLAPAPPPRVRGLVVAADGRWFCCEASEPVSLMKRRALRRLLLRLAEQRHAAPGVALSLHDLLEAGWPGERTTYEAGNARVYNALTTLRKLGLRATLVSRDDGYLLDPAVALRLAPEGGDLAWPAAAA
jgi:predicted ATPase